MDFRGLLILLLASQVSAATYYIDFAGGSDGNNGTSTSTPWAHCPGDTLATNTASTTVLGAGDQVIFKGGVEYKSSIVISKSGAPGNLLTFDGNTAGSFGTGMAIMNGGNVNNDNRRYGFQFSLPFANRSTLTLLTSNILIRGFEFTRFGGRGTYDPANITWTCSTKPSAVEGYGIDIGGARDVYIGSCLFTNIGDWTNAPNMSYSLASGHGIYLHNFGHNLTITNNEFTQVGNAAIQLTALAASEWITNIFIGSNNLHDFIQWGVLINPNAAATNCFVNSIYVTNNSLHDMWQYSPNAYLGCSGEFPHTDGIFCFLGYSPTPTQGATLGTTNAPMVIANNDFYTSVNYTNLGGTANIYLSGYGGRVLVYNNVFRNVLNQGEGGVFVYGDFDWTANNCTAVDYEFYNNSFYDQTYGIILQSHTQAKALTNGTVIVKNNAFYHDVVTNFALPLNFGSDAWSKPTACDYNSYFTIRSDGIVATSWTNSTDYMDFAEMQRQGYEAHGKSGNPKYVDISYGLTTNSVLNDLKLQATSPLIDAGLDLSALFSTDKSGNARPTGAWDIGAYEYSSAVVPVTTSRLSGNAVLSGNVRVQ